MSAAAAVLPYVWAVAARCFGPALPQPAAPEPVLPDPCFHRPAHILRRDVAFYRKYSEALLRRYVRMSMEAGKVPSLLGKEMFRGFVTNYRVESFEDVVIFLHDVEHCLEQLAPEEQRLITRIGLEQFTVDETAAAFGLNQRTVIRRYGQAMDRLTEIFLRVKMLEPQKCCQGV